VVGGWRLVFSGWQQTSSLSAAKKYLPKTQNFCLSLPIAFLASGDVFV